MRWGSSVFYLILLAACATKGETRSEGSDEDTEVAVKESNDGLGDAVLAPAEDFNLIRDEIPETLKNLKSAYGPLKGDGCAAITEEIIDLSIELGFDEDELAHEPETKSEKLSKGAADLTLSTVEGAATGFIPFRGLVRQATGASAYAKKVRAAYQRGLLRRAYLKGMGKAMGCAPPASPLPPPDPPAD